MSDFSTALKVLVDQYSYHNAFLLLQKHGPLNSDLLFLLEMMKERRELNIDFLFAHQEQVVILQEKYNIKLLHNPYDLELLANYIMDLEAKVKNGLIIDFVRSVSPILYRLFMILLAQEVPLAHLIKPFDEQELYRTTQFSSQAFLDQIIFLAKVIGVEYDTVNFHYDTVNKLIIKILE
ncbi:TPA: hypothetical protein ACGUD5_000692 [Streptococcus agalactiae]